MQHTMTQPDITLGKRPRVAGMVLVAALKGIFAFLVVRQGLDEAYKLPAAMLDQLPTLYWLYMYGMLLIFAPACLVTAVLIAFYKRVGLNFGLVVFGLELALTALFMLPPFNINTSIFAVALTGYVLYYAWRYKTHVPEMTFFK